MASVGSADLLIVPKFNNFTAQVNGALGAASTSASAAGTKLGTATGGGFGKGLTASGAVIGAFSSITSAAMSAISSHVGGAVSRFDTLNNYPIVMQNLGYSAKDAASSLELMDTHLQGLPTAINDMASTVQGLTAVTGDLDKATQAGLALNDMLLASGSNTQLTSAAMEQFRQILAKGKPDMQDWKSLTSAMPGQMNQLAQAMLGPTATANDLYAALGGGGAEATISMDQLLDAMIQLDSEGSGSMASFADQAKTVTDAVETSMANTGTAVTRGITKVMDAVGKDTFGGVSQTVISGINGISDAVAGLVSGVVPTVKSIVSTFGGLAPAAAATTAAFAVMQGNGGKLISVLKTMNSAANGFATVYGSAVISGTGKATAAFQAAGATITKHTTGIQAALKSLVTPANLASAAVVGITAAVGIGLTLWNEYQTNVENAAKATSGMADAVDRASNLDGYSSTIAGVGESAGNTAKNVNDLNESIAANVDKMNENTATAESTIATLNTAQQIIGQYAGQTDLSTDAQGRLAWALQTVNEQFGLNLTAADVAANSYTDADGAVQNLTESVNNLIEAKKQEARVSAITSNLSLAYTSQSEAAASYTKAVQELNTERERYESLVSQGTATQADADAMKAAQDNADEAKAALDSTTEAVKNYEEQLGSAESAAQGMASATETWVNGNVLLDQGLASNGQSISQFAADLDAMGASTEQMGKLSSEQLATLASSYDGTMGSISGLLQQYGVDIDASAVETQNTINAITETLSGWDCSGTFDAMNMSVSDFAQKLSDAGMKADDFRDITTEDFQGLVDSCGGNVDQMVQALGLYNATEIIDKEGNVDMNDAKLVDAQGNIYTWNGSKLVNKNGKAAVNDTKLMDAQGNVWTWNGSKLVNKNGKASINTSSLDNGKTKVDNWNAGGSSLLDKKGTVTIEGVISGATEVVKKFFHWRSGGIRTHASGGIRKHADGAIVNVPGTGVPLDMVGEDGAEAIVPLTNKRYSAPFAKTIAEQMQQLGGAAGTVINVSLNYSAGDDANQMARDIARALRRVTA